MRSSSKSVKSDRYFSRFFLKRHKAQFFILSAFAIVAMFYLISGWIEPFTIIDTSQVALMDEIFIFNNIKEKTAAVVNGSKSCDDIIYNLQEYKSFAESYAYSKGYNLNFSYIATPCASDYDIPVYFTQINITLQSPRGTLNSQFLVPWPS